MNYFQINRKFKMSKGKALIDSLLQSKKVVVISKSYCPFCRKAKVSSLKSFRMFYKFLQCCCLTFQTILDKYKMSSDNMAWLDIEKRDDQDEIQDYCKKLTGARSVSKTNKKETRNFLPQAASETQFLIP